MLLWNEERIETPETRLDKRGSWHLGKAEDENDRSGRLHAEELALTNPISRKMLRISSRTFSNGWREPPLGYMPSASKLYFLKCADFQVPLYKADCLGGYDKGKQVHGRR